MRNPLDIASQLELDGKAYYLRQAARTTDDKIKQVFEALAQDEERHYRVVQDMKKGQPSQSDDTNAVDVVKRVFAEKPQKTDELMAEITVLDAYEEAINLEQQSVDLYEGLAEEAVGPEQKALFARLVDEEKSHKTILWKLMELIQRPEEWYPYLNL